MNKMSLSMVFAVMGVEGVKNTLSEAIHPIGVEIDRAGQDTFYPMSRDKSLENRRQFVRG